MADLATKKREAEEKVIGMAYEVVRRGIPDEERAAAIVALAVCCDALDKANIEFVREYGPDA